ncbi:MAG: hypothetical protein ACLFWL_04980 [Candidatus Brocadiia bacterium]
MKVLRLIVQALNNREIASLAWGLPIVIALLIKKDIRSRFLDIAHIGATPKIILPFVALLLYVFTVVGILAEIDFWTPILLKNTVLWFFGTAVVLFLKSPEALNSPSTFFWIQIKRIVALTALLSFLVGLYTFPLTVEYFFIPFVTSVVVFQQFSSVKHGDQAVHRLFTGIATVIGLLLITFTAHRLFAGPGGLNMSQLRSLALPVVLSFSVLPFLYLWAIFMAYDTIYRMTKDEFEGRTRLPWLIWWKTINGCHLNLKKLNIMRTKGVFWLRGLDTESEIRGVLQELGVAEEQDAVTDEKQRCQEPDIRHGLTKDERKTIWAELVRAEDRAEVESGIEYPLTIEEIAPDFVFENERKIILDKSPAKVVPPGSRIEVTERNESDMLYVKAYDANQQLCEGWIGLQWLYNQSLNLIEKNLESNRVYRNQLQHEYEHRVFERFGIDEETEHAITLEAIENNWKSPEPLTVTEYLERE